MSLSLRLLIASTPLCIWAALYALARSGLIRLERLSSLLRAGCFVCLPVWGFAMVFDQTHLADGAIAVFWGFFGAETWIEHKLKKASAS